MKTILDWSTVMSERGNIRLLGVIDGKLERTSPVVRAVGRDVTTASGSVYHLGRISAQERAFMKERGLKYDPTQPIKVTP